jgi:hypothetical protein
MYMRGRVAYVAGYEAVSHGRRGRLWAFGLAPDAQLPPGYARAAPKRKNRTELAAFTTMVEAMLCEPQSTSQLCEMSGSSRGTVYRMLRIAKGFSFCSVVEWDREGTTGDWKPHYQFGVGLVGKQRPARMSTETISARYRDGKKARAHQMVVNNALAANNPSFNMTA